MPPRRAVDAIRSATARLPNTRSHCSRDSKADSDSDGDNEDTDEDLGDDSVSFAHFCKALA